jgi:glycosyltransferase involved in cell wall biosynthesis
VPEIVDEGVTGFIVRNEAQACEAVRRAAALDRRQVRRRVGERFSAAAMAARYLDLYGRLQTARPGAPVGAIA